MNEVFLDTVGLIAAGMFRINGTPRRTPPIKSW